MRSIAKRCGVPLKIAAKVDAVDRDYFEAEIRKLITPPDVEYIGEISDGEKSSFLSGAIALLAPIAWPEPFGLVLIEAMACGTPVIAFNRGSVPEIVEDGLTGFVVKTKRRPWPRLIVYLSSLAVPFGGASRSGSPHGGWRGNILLSIAAL